MLVLCLINNLEYLVRFLYPRTSQPLVVLESIRVIPLLCSTSQDTPSANYSLYQVISTSGTSLLLDAWSIYENATSHRKPKRFCSLFYKSFLKHMDKTFFLVGTPINNYNCVIKINISEDFHKSIKNKQPSFTM